MGLASTSVQLWYQPLPVSHYLRPKLSTSCLPGLRATCTAALGMSTQNQLRALKGTVLRSGPSVAAFTTFCALIVYHISFDCVSHHRVVCRCINGFETRVAMRLRNLGHRE